MNEKLKIKVTIGDRVYPLTIKSEGEEEGVRKAVKKINDLIKKFEENYLPPEWIDLQEDIDDNILRIGQLFEELTPLRQ